MLKDEAKRQYQRDYMKEYQKKKRSKQTGLNIPDNVAGSKQYPDILDKLTDSAWRGRLEKICNAFQGSHHLSYAKDVWLGDTNLNVVCDLLECTR